MQRKNLCFLDLFFLLLILMCQIFYACMIIKAYRSAFIWKKCLYYIFCVGSYSLKIPWMTCGHLRFCEVSSFQDSGRHMTYNCVFLSIILTCVQSYLLNCISMLLLQFILRNTVNCKYVYWELFSYVRHCSLVLQFPLYGNSSQLLIPEKKSIFLLWKIGYFNNIVTVNLAPDCFLLYLHY